MSFSDLYTPGFKIRNRDHFAAIVRVALADGKISEEEQAFINRTAINLEIEADEVAQIIEHIEEHPINPPSTNNFVWNGCMTLHVWFLQMLLQTLPKKSLCYVL